MWLAVLFRRGACLEEVDQISAKEQIRLLVGHRRQAALYPPQHGLPADTQDFGDFGDFIVAVGPNTADAGAMASHFQSTPCSISARMSLTRQAVMRGPSLTGCG
jgi:hypothetical protein